jgi:quercetin dioxygenase-like cupin family protein
VVVWRKSDIVSDIVSPTPCEPIEIENVATKETYAFLDRAADTAGEVLRLRWSGRAGGRVGEHIHPLQEERFEVVDGVLTVSIEGRGLTCAKGEAITVPPGKRHSFANRTSAPVTAILEIRPALRMEEVFESLAAFAREGRAGPDGLPRNPLLLGVFAHEFKDEIRGVRPPYALQRALLPALAALGRWRGHRAHRPEYRAEASIPTRRS